MAQPCYNVFEVMVVSVRVDQLIEEVRQLSHEELRILYGFLIRQLATPLRDPHELYDDWDDPEVDATYAETW
ncbi:MAG: hypothetical protein GX295_11825 [Syntrophomonadaceae bacterium]|nr:hypothetical protein [Syntrophomonadaceae bacterium]